MTISRAEYLEWKVGAYVRGFNEFDTSVISLDNTMSIGIYYDITKQDSKRADQLKKRFEFQIRKILDKIEWGKEIKVTVTVYSEDRTGRGY